MKERIKRFIATTLSYFGIAPARPGSPVLQQSASERGSYDDIPGAEPCATTESKLWNPPAALSREALAVTVRAIAHGIRSQMTSPFVNDGTQPELYAKLDAISASLMLIPPRRFFPDSLGITEMGAADRIHRADLAQLPVTPEAGESRTRVANALFGYASALKTQVLASPVLAAHEMRKLKDQLSDAADTLNGISGDVCIARSRKRAHSR